MDLREFIRWRESLDEQGRAVAREIAADILFGEVFAGDAQLFDLRDAIVARVERRLAAADAEVLARWQIIEPSQEMEMEMEMEMEGGTHEPQIGRSEDRTD
jgi:hypothetical protein